MSSLKKLPREQWPAALLETPEPPQQLWIEGELPEPHFIYLTVIGSRKYSNYGREVCEKLVAELSHLPIVIVSGLALGIDTIAHKSALQNNLKTIAFPGSGLDRQVIHPHTNKKLADQIIEAGGALISEFDPTYPAGLHTFPKRNRLMAGLAKATLVIEAGERSGTLITARLALDYNREVLAVPGSIFSLGSLGTNRLIRQGATPVTGGDDVAEALGFERRDTDQLSLKLESLSPTERQIIELLQIEPLSRDDLIRTLALPISEANSLLAVMEIKGLIKEAMGEIYIA